MLGLKRGMVELLPHQEEWQQSAAEVIDKLKALLGRTAIEIQHVGSTAIRGVHAKPIVDLVIGTAKLEDVADSVALLELNGLIFRGSDVPGQLLFVIGDGDFRTHHIHVVPWKGSAWNNYINFRDYLNACPEKAKAYDALKLRLAEQFADDRVRYSRGKQELIDRLLAEAVQWRQKENTQ